MSKLTIVARFVLVTFLPFASSVLAGEEGITQNADGDYVITYRGQVSGQQIQWLWVPKTKIAPVVSWKVKRSEKNNPLSYRYTFVNGRTSRQDVKAANTTVSSVVLNSQVTPLGWFGTVARDTGRSSGTIVGWFFRENGGIKPGSSQSGFGIESDDLPGVGVVRLYGLAQFPTLKQLSPPGADLIDELSETDPVFEQYKDLSAHDFVVRYTAIPKIPVGNPYNGAAVLDALRTHITKDIVELKLVEPTLASQLDRSLQAAADAIRRNTPKAAKEHLKDAMSLLKKDHPDCDKEDADDKDDGDDKNTKGKTGSIDRLAARVIAFDIKYVEKRLK